MKTAVRTPTNAVTANATVGKGPEIPKFWKKKIESTLTTNHVVAHQTVNHSIKMTQ